jgi:hypothetical protein
LISSTFTAFTATRDLVADLDAQLIERIARHHRFYVGSAGNLDADLAHDGPALDVDDLAFQPIACTDFHEEAPWVT